MTDTNYRFAQDGGPDDLPRTLRREREAREREARERESAAQHQEYGLLEADPRDQTEEPFPAIVKRFDVSFLRLVVFFLKAVLAAIPALILLGVILWFAGHLLQQFYPQLVKMQILIRFPN